MRRYKLDKFKDHPSISSEYIKFICHNSPFELVESLETKFKSIENEFKDFKTKNSNSAKQLNTVTQKAEDSKSKIGTLESRVAKLEKK